MKNITNTTDDKRDDWERFKDRVGRPHLYSGDTSRNETPDCGDPGPDCAEHNGACD